MTKQTALPRPLVSLSVRVPAETADRLKEIAEAEYRPVAAEIRRLIEQRVDEAAAAADRSEVAA